MGNQDIAEDVRSFIGEHIDSVEKLEVLLLLFRTRPREWTALQVSRELRIDPASAGRRLDDFCARQLLRAREGAEALHYSYASDDVAHGQLMDDVARAYAERRTTIISLIFAAPVRDVRVFADAFRLRKKERP